MPAEFHLKTGCYVIFYEFPTILIINTNINSSRIIPGRKEWNNLWIYLYSWFVFIIKIVLLVKILDYVLVHNYLSFHFWKLIQYFLETGNEGLSNGISFIDHLWILKMDWYPTSLSLKSRGKSWKKTTKLEKKTGKIRRRFLSLNHLNKFQSSWNLVYTQVRYLLNILKRRKIAS